jgi:hypothetical protein
MSNQVFYEKYHVEFSEVESFVDSTEEKKSKLKNPFPHLKYQRVLFQMRAARAFHLEVY